LRLLALQLAGVRNLAPLVLEPSPRFNVFSGDNGQGKTNLLEAIYLVGTLRSFRTGHLRELIAFGGEEASVRARVARGGLERLYEVRLDGARKRARLDGKTPRSMGEYFGGFNVVLFAPEDLRVPRGAPGERRRFLDRSVFNRDVGFLPVAQRYARILKSRNGLIRQDAPDLELLDVYDAQLAETGAEVVAARTRYLEELAPRFAAAFEAITHTGLPATLAYRPAAEDLAAGLARGRRRDLARRQTGCGPHVDDLELLLDGRPARAYASQGQLRALVLAWKTAEMRLLREALGDAPVLLLDDVSSELDPSRNRHLFDFLDEIECQAFVTTTHPKHVLATQNRLDFQLVAGDVRPSPNG
jgi:DNA replication and repair protein RecF